MLIAACSLQSLTINKVPGNTFTLQHDYAKPYKYIAYLCTSMVFIRKAVKEG